MTGGGDGEQSGAASAYLGLTQVGDVNTEPHSDPLSGPTLRLSLTGVVLRATHAPVLCFQWVD